jgi:hypothetical protein
VKSKSRRCAPHPTAGIAVGPTRRSSRVEFSSGRGSTLISAIQLWADSVTVEDLPPGIWRLRCALGDQLADADHRTR